MRSLRRRVSVAFLVCLAVSIGYILLRANFAAPDVSLAQRQINQLIHKINNANPTDEYVLSARNVFNYTISENFNLDTMNSILDNSIYRGKKKNRLLIAMLVNTNNLNTQVIERNYEHTAAWCDFILVSFGTATYDISQKVKEKIMVKHARSIETIVEENVVNKQISKMKLASLDHTTHPKPLLYLELLDYVDDYENLMIIDDDVLLDGLDFPRLLKQLDCIAPLVSQSAVKGGPKRYVPFLNYDDNRFTEKEYISSGFIEMQCPIFNSDYFKYFVEHCIKPMIGPIVLLGSDNGIDNIWCQVASRYSSRHGYINDACVVFVDQYVNHLNFQTSRLIHSDYSHQALRDKELVYLFIKNYKSYFIFGNISKAKVKKFIPELCQI